MGWLHSTLALHCFRRGFYFENSFRSFTRLFPVWSRALGWWHGEVQHRSREHYRLREGGGIGESNRIRKWINLVLLFSPLCSVMVVVRIDSHCIPMAPLKLIYKLLLLHCLNRTRPIIKENKIILSYVRVTDKNALVMPYFQPKTNLFCLIRLITSSPVMPLKDIKIAAMAMPVRPYPAWQCTAIW